MGLPRLTISVRMIALSSCDEKELTAIVDGAQEMNRDYRIFDRVYIMRGDQGRCFFQNALLTVAPPYFSTPLSGGQEQYGERVFAHELFRQLRLQPTKERHEVCEFAKGPYLVFRKRTDLVP